MSAASVLAGAGARVRRTPAAVAVVFGLGVLLRLAFMFFSRPGFVGYADSSGFIANAREQLFGEVFRTAGYPLFLRIVHFFSDELAMVAVIQHALGVGTAGLLYLAARRLGAPVWTALLPAAVVLFGGTQLFLEHSVLSDAPFTFLVALSVFLAAYSHDSSRSALWLAGAGCAAGCAAVVRPAGLLLIPALALWGVVSASALRQRAVGAIAVVIVGLVPLGLYVVAQRHYTGYTGLTRTDGWSLYARTAEFAKCSEFEPPAGTRSLCEASDPDTRPAANSYLYEVSASPARKRFGSPPAADDKLSAFAWQAIIHQPLSYARVVIRDSLRPVFYGWIRPGSGLVTPVLIDDLPDRAAEENLAVPIGLYWDPPGFKRSHIGAFRSYAKVARVEGPVMGVFYVLALLGSLLLKDRRRNGALLFSLAGAALIIAPAATLFYDVRYATPAYGLLAAAAAFGALGIKERLRRSDPPSPEAGS